MINFTKNICKRKHKMIKILKNNPQYSIFCQVLDN
jgi:hypothetical protein